MIIEKEQMICENLSRNADGVLCLGGVAVDRLAMKYGTPLSLYDEDRIRYRCRTYKRAMCECFGDSGQVLYASKAASFKRLYEIMREEDMGIDVVSMGEIATAIRADFPLSRAYFHSNNKTDADIEYAIKNGIGDFVVDNAEELYSIDRIAGELGTRQKILLRLTPGIDPHTYEAVATGKVDSKFGSAIETGQAEEITITALGLSNIKLVGFHCHIGSQVFDSSVYLAAAEVMISFVAQMYREHGFLASELDLGGGWGVRYTKDMPVTDIAAGIGELSELLHSRATELGIPLPKISLEPGRSIVADAGMTVYTVGTVKRIPGYKTYVSVDGGMTDNPRYALYGAPYTLLPVSRPVGDCFELCSVVGRCCESGDILQENQPMPTDICRGELIACLTTGAYNYSMASNYNRIARPPVVMLSGGEDYLAVRRETLDDLTAYDI